MIKEVIVVEGSNDTKKLQSFFDVETIETHGLGIKKETIELIKKVNENRGVILLLDPDTPGEKIRTKINNEIPNLKNAFLLKENARTKKKVGVEHASKQIIEAALNNLVTYSDDKNSLSREEYDSLGLSGQSDSVNKRDVLSKEFHLGKCNSKTMFKRLNMIGITKKDIENVL